MMMMKSRETESRAEHGSLVKIVELEAKSFNFLLMKYSFDLYLLNNLFIYTSRSDRPDTTRPICIIYIYLRMNKMYTRALIFLSFYGDDTREELRRKERKNLLKSILHSSWVDEER